MQVISLLPLPLVTRDDAADVMRFRYLRLFDSSRACLRHAITPLLRHFHDVSPAV